MSGKAKLLIDDREVEFSLTYDECFKILNLAESAIETTLSPFYLTPREDSQ